MDSGPTLPGPYDISLKLTVAVVSGFLLGDLVLILLPQVIYSFNLIGVQGTLGD